MQINSNTDLPAPLEAYKLHLYTEEASRNTTNAYLSDLAHFVSWYEGISSLTKRWIQEDVCARTASSILATSAAGSLTSMTNLV
jgi:site-specific recombinase XerD